ncbi:MAG: sugar ABC transporter ATP-binding protein [Rhodobacteraceae bacterium]|nr:sugar ABC transporter ATP-binding protein [Paracoccaceae bacterium]
MRTAASGRIDLALEGITKTYPGAVALDGVSLSVTGGEIVGLIGENGAGKSTLLKILGGGIAPTRGTIRIDGQAHAQLDPARAGALGIAFVHQELNAFDNMDVTANILLGREITRGPLGRLDRRAMAEAVRPVLDLVGARFGPEDQVADLSLAELQQIEICRALSRDARLLILDEPTSSLTLAESARLIDIILGLRRSGVAILLVSHRLSEVEACADRVVVLRDGRKAGELVQGAITREAMTRLMIGRDLERGRARAPRPPDGAGGRAALALAGLRTRAFPGAVANLAVRAGEIVGLAGLVGAGRTELARAAFGIDPPAGGEVRVNGVALPPGDIAAALREGLCLVPEDRKSDGLFLDFSVAANIAQPNLRSLSRRGVVDRAAEARMAQAARRDLGIKAASTDQAAAELSGGNQQKVVLAKWLAMEPRAIILDEPTRGIDVGAKAEVHDIMRRLAARGVGILVISSDMDEVISLSHRVAVMRRGAIVAELEGDRITEMNIMSSAVD